MTRYFYLYVIIGVLFAFCSNTDTKTDNNNKLAGNISEVERKGNYVLSKDTVKLKGFILGKVKIIKVISLSKHITQDTVDNEYYKKCADWSLTERNIINLIQFFKPINRHEFNYQYYVLPCEMKGIIELDGREFAFLINAGSYMKLFGSDTTLLFGCHSNSCKKYFLAESE